VIFLAFNVDFRAVSSDFLGSRRASKRGTVLKNDYFSDIGSSTVRTVTDKHILLLIKTRTGDELLVVLTLITLNNLEPTKLKVLVFLRLSHSLKCLEIDQDLSRIS